MVGLFFMSGAPQRQQLAAGAGGCLLRGPCPPSGTLEGGAHKRSAVGGMERSGRPPEESSRRSEAI